VTSPARKLDGNTVVNVDLKDGPELRDLSADCRYVTSPTTRPCVCSLYLCSRRRVCLLSRLYIFNK